MRKDCILYGISTANPSAFPWPVHPFSSRDQPLKTTVPLLSRPLCTASSTIIPTAVKHFYSLHSPFAHLDRKEALVSQNMKSLTIALALLLHLTTLSLAAPLHATLIEERVFLASLTFYGAGPSGESFFQQIPADDQVHPISKTFFFFSSSLATTL